MDKAVIYFMQTREMERWLDLLCLIAQKKGQNYACNTFSEC